MFCALKASLFISTLALLASASPIKDAGCGIHIPLSAPPSLTKPDGTFDLEQGLLHYAAIQKYITPAFRILGWSKNELTTIHLSDSKYRRNLINREPNAGLGAFNEVSLIFSDEGQPALTDSYRA
jgi:hypothetical protein